MRPFLAIAGLCLLTVNAEELVNVHEDIGVNYDSTQNALVMTIRDEALKREYRTDHAFHRVPVGAKLTIPNLPAFSFLGPVGSSTWILPQTQNTSLLYLGISAENKTLQSGWQAIGVASSQHLKGVGTGIFVGNKVTLTLTALRGPGHFALYNTNASGVPTVFINSRDGLTAADKLDVTANVHAHYNFAFSAKGFYQLTLQARGTRTSDGVIIESIPATYFFGVEANPYTYANWAAGYETTYGLAAGTLSANSGGDLDADGLTNYAEYALQWMGADPAVPQVELVKQGAATSQLFIDYVRDSLKTGVIVHSQASNNLSTWFDSTDLGAPTGYGDALHEARTSTGTVEERRATLSTLSLGRNFLRLRMNP